MGELGRAGSNSHVTRRMAACLQIWALKLVVLVGVSQKRIARIESAPEKVSFEQVTKLLMILGTNLVIVDKAQPLATNVRTSRPAKREENW